MPDKAEKFWLEPQSEGISLSFRHCNLSCFDRQLGAEVIAEFQHVESGRKADRTGLAVALAMCRARRATLLIAKLDRLARSVAFISNLMEGGVGFVAADMPSVNRLTVHVLAAVAEHKMISQRTKAALAAAKVRGTQLGNPRLPTTGTLAEAPTPLTAGGKARIIAAQARAITAYGPVIQEARSAGALSLGDYAQALQAARVPTPRGGDRWSRSAAARVLRYCKSIDPKG